MIEDINLYIKNTTYKEHFRIKLIKEKILKKRKHYNDMHKSRVDVKNPIMNQLICSGNDSMGLINLIS